MRLHWSRILSLLVATTYVAVATLHLGAEGFWKICCFLILPLFGIWFPRSLGAYTGGLARHPITRTSPGGVVSFACWILLLAPVVAYLIVTLS